MTPALIIATAIEIALVVFMLFMSVYFFYVLIGMISFAPFVYSGDEKAMVMLELAELKEGTRVLEVGSGNGEICIRAAKAGAVALGIEINPILVCWSRMRALRRGVAGRTTFKPANMWRYRLPPETEIVFVYGLPERMERLWNKMQTELKPGTRVVSNAFKFPQALPVVERGSVRVYRLP